MAQNGNGGRAQRFPLSATKQTLRRALSGSLIYGLGGRFCGCARKRSRASAFFAILLFLLRARIVIGETLLLSPAGGSAPLAVHPPIAAEATTIIRRHQGCGQRRCR